MDDLEIRRRIDKYLMEICHYSQMQVFATSEYQKRYLQYQIDWVANELVDLFLVSRDSAVQQQLAQPAMQPEQMQPEQMQPEQTHPEQMQPEQTHPEQTQPEQTQPAQQQPIQPQPVESPESQLPQKVFTLEELAQNDGRGGKPAYVAISGKVHDVTALLGWAGGNHFGLHAGHDLTSEFMGCHRNLQEVLQRAPVIGTLQK